MKKNSLVFSDLSKKQIENLKNHYIQTKVDSMSQKDLKDFVLEIISHQINNTIGKEEEMEAWEEMSSFFGEEFQNIILDIMEKYSDENSNRQEENDHQKRIELLEKNNIKEEKTDMWDD